MTDEHQHVGGSVGHDGSERSADEGFSRETDAFAREGGGMEHDAGAPPGDPREERSGVSAGVLLLVLSMGGPVVLASAGTLTHRRRPALVLRSCAAGGFLLLAFLFAFSAGLVYMVATGLMVAAAVQAAAVPARPACCENVAVAP